MGSTGGMGERVSSPRLAGSVAEPQPKSNVVPFYQSRLNVLGGPEPARLMGPLSFLWPTWKGGVP